MHDYTNGHYEASGKDNWITPPHIIKALEERYGPLFDPCPADSNLQILSTWDGKTDGLEMNWPQDQVCFVNPPFSNLAAWAKKVWQQSYHYGVEVVMLLPARTDTKYFHNFICNDAELEFFKGRIRFINPETGKPGEAAPFPTMLAHYTQRNNYTRYQKCPIPARPVK
jgi:phage N-6-adenine-methyltransferase